MLATSALRLIAAVVAGRANASYRSESALAATDSGRALGRHAGRGTIAAERGPTLRMAELFIKKQGQCLAFIM